MENINLNQIELEICTECNLHCLNCDRSCTQAVSNEYMTLDQISEFIKESKELNWKWKRISLLGGEPTLHINFFEILEILNKYRLETGCEIEVVTNGFGNKVKKTISEIPNWVLIRNSNKTSPIQYFYSYNVASIDLNEYKNSDFSKGCWVSGYCGIGLTVNGYYPCGAGASVDRVFNKGIGIEKLKDVNETSLRQQMKFLCSVCGHFKRNFEGTLITSEIMSETWKDAYLKYNENKNK